ncbi:trace amine-associated receptor 9-like [Diadema antillarum]|uniref:trace amine-associated receptor 9-like n=1 Tax=Diadema antillarum TaxID=105358 RepID=UPI003A8B4FFA
MALNCRSRMNLAGLFIACLLLQQCMTEVTEFDIDIGTTFLTSTNEAVATDVDYLVAEDGNYTESSTFTMPLEESDSIDYWQWQPVAFMWWSILQLASAFIGFFGNGLVMLVVFQRKAKRNSTDKLIGSLAVADFLTSLFLVPVPDVINIPSTWLGELYCKVMYTARFMWISVSASVFTLTLISVERFVAVAYPFRFKTLFSRQLTVTYILIVWLLAVIMNSFAFFIFHVDADAHRCVIIFPTANGGEVLGIVSFFLVLVIPIVVMLTTQGLTAYQLHVEAKRFQGETLQKMKSQPSFRLILAKKRVIKLLFIINATFIICWAPNQSAYLAFNLGLLGPSFLYGPFDRALVVLAFCNSCANPIIYTIQHRQFRNAIKALFTGSKEASKTPVFMKES